MMRATSTTAGTTSANGTTRITMRIVEKIASGEIVWDSLVRGFGLRCQRTRKVYILKANISGRPRWFTIGEHGAPWTPDTARAEAQVLWGRIRAGEDLAAIREARRQRATVSDLCTRYIEDHAREHKKASSAHLDERNIENHIRPLLGELFVDDVTRADIDRFKRAIKDGKTKKPGETNRTSFRGGKVVAGGAVVANRCLSLLSKMFNLAEMWGWRPDNTNPVRHIEKYKESKRDRYLSAEEFTRLGDVMAKAAEEGSESPFALAAIRLLIFSGARLDEILSLRWDHVDLDQRVLKLPDSKTGRKLVWLSPPAIAVLSAIPRVEDNPYVIVGAREGAHLVNLQKPWRRIRRRAGIDNGRIHDLRHSFASVAVASGVGLFLTGKILGHLRTSTTERYAHLADDPVRQANDLIGRRIQEALDTSETDTEKVIQKRVS
jgi:integrase